MRIASSSHFIISSSIFERCISETEAGGAIFFNQTLTFDVSKCFFEKCQSNADVPSSARHGSGGAIFCDCSGGILSCCFFRKNRASSYGASVYCTTKANALGQKLKIDGISDTQSSGITCFMIEYGEQDNSYINMSFLKEIDPTGGYHIEMDPRKSTIKYSQLCNLKYGIGIGGSDLSANNLIFSSIEPGGALLKIFYIKIAVSKIYVSSCSKAYLFLKQTDADQLTIEDSYIGDVEINNAFTSKGVVLQDMKTVFWQSCKYFMPKSPQHMRLRANTVMFSFINCFTK